MTAPWDYTAITPVLATFSSVCSALCVDCSFLHLLWTARRSAGIQWFHDTLGRSEGWSDQGEWCANHADDQKSQLWIAEWPELVRGATEHVTEL